MYKSLLSYVSIIALVMQFICWPAHAEETDRTAQPMMTLPAGTPLNLEMLEELYSQRNHEGDEIVFALKEDVVVMGKTYLIAGTPVLGRVTHQRAARSWGRSGSLDIEITGIAPPYGMPISLSGTQTGTSGGSNTAMSIGTTVLLGISVLGLLAGGSVAGHGAVIAAGTSVTVFTANDGSIMDISRDKMQEMVDDWYTHKVTTSFLSYSPAGVKTVSDAMRSMGYSVGESQVTVEPIEEHKYRVEVQISPTETATFTFQPFQETHGWKFNTMKADNELAAGILKQVR